VNLYYYSGSLLTVVRVKWAFAKFVVGGVFVGSLLLFGVVKLHQSVADTIGTDSTNALKAENAVLRQQISLIAPSVTRLELQADLLRERTNGLHKLLQRRKNVRDTVSSFTKATELSSFRSSMAVARSPRP
jgi:hypothetical protein